MDAVKEHLAANNIPATGITWSTAMDMFDKLTNGVTIKDAHALCWAYNKPFEKIRVGTQQPWPHPPSASTHARARSQLLGRDNSKNLLAQYRASRIAAAAKQTSEEGEGHTQRQLVRQQCRQPTPLHMLTDSPDPQDAAAPPGE